MSLHFRLLEGVLGLHFAFPGKSPSPLDLTSLPGGGKEAQKLLDSSDAVRLIWTASGTELQETEWRQCGAHWGAEDVSGGTMVRSRCCGAGWLWACWAGLDLDWA